MPLDITEHPVPLGITEHPVPLEITEHPVPLVFAVALTQEMKQQLR